MHVLSHMTKPFSPACERNQGFILKELKEVLKGVRTVLEIGAGTGQHAVHFAEHMPWLIWQCSDIQENLLGINMWVKDSGLMNLPRPIELDVSAQTIATRYDAIYSSNTLHIMSKTHVEDFFRLISALSHKRTELIVYGPFNYGGEYTSESNANFDISLKSRNRESGIRDFEWINDLAKNIGFTLVDDKEMPANNRLIHWRYSD